MWYLSVEESHNFAYEYKLTTSISPKSTTPQTVHYIIYSMHTTYFCVPFVVADARKGILSVATANK